MFPSMEDRQDVILSIHPQHVANIVSRVKNHEFRNYLLPHSVQRLWIYETSPLSSIRYVATISHGKRPGEICDPSGLRNDEFDRGDMEGRVKYAYQILKLERLQMPYSLADLKANGWLNGAPQKYCFLKPCMRGIVSSFVLELIFDSTGTMLHGEEPSKSTSPAARIPKRHSGPENRQPQGISKPKGKQMLSNNQGKRQASLQHWVEREASTAPVNEYMYM